MISIWINKEINKPSPNKDMLIFNILEKNNKSNVHTDIERLWREFGEKGVSKVVEDLVMIGIAVYIVDKRISRSSSPDNWTRDLQLNIPVLDIEKWENVKIELENTLSFLSGDRWNIKFYHTEERFRSNKLKKNPSYNASSFDCVSLFSGGLDSFAGSLSLLNQKKNPFFVGFKEYKLLVGRQKKLIGEIDNYYNSQHVSFENFNVSPKLPINGALPNKLLTESTSRSRSLLFIVGAVLVASIIGEKTPVYIPENGFIGINVPLTMSRNGSCSTRTTHPNFINSMNKILNDVGIKNTIENFYADKSKGEIVKEHKENPIFKENYAITLSCSHPCQSRYDKVRTPMNCGYCYPCLIRKSSLISNGFIKEDYNPNYEINKEFLDNNKNFNSKSSDLRALLFSIRRYVDIKEDNLKIKMLLIRQGNLPNEELEKYVSVYKKTMNELLVMIKYVNGNQNKDLINYIGLHIDG